MVVYYHKDRVS